jgi:rhamnosyltransferase
MFTEKNICGIVVTYNCNSSFNKNLEILLSQVDFVIIIDNGSSQESLNYINEYINNDAIKIIYNKHNMGIAYALNQGLNQANEKDYSLFLTMDQDSELQEDAVYEMLEVLNANKNIISVGPNIYNKNPQNNDAFALVDRLITSGNLTYTNIAIEIGGYENKLFIDGVDFDFSLKLKETGKNIALIYKSKIIHKVGEYEDARFLLKKFRLKSHSPVRHYYIYRNNLFIIKKYFSKHPIFCMKRQYAIFTYFFQVLFVQQNKKKKLKMIFRGIKDYQKGIYGEYLPNSIRKSEK